MATGELVCSVDFPSRGEKCYENRGDRFKTVYIITKLHPDIKSANLAKLALLNFMVETREGRTPRPSGAPLALSAQQNIICAASTRKS